MASVKVAVRVRPVNKRELEMKCPVIISMDGNNTHITNTKLPVPSTPNDSFGRERVKQFTFDYSYWSLDPDDPHYCSQKKVFDELGQEVVEAALTGYNACMFAYGQTGSGKTYTMMGTSDNYGLTPRVCESLFANMYDGDTSYRTEISYLEIYNERVRDLLRDRQQPQLNLRVREHPKEGPYVQELSKHLVMNYGDIEELLRQGNANRTTAATNMNDHSSRSHAIFTIVFTQAKFNEDIPSEVRSKIHLVDLAGSERADAAGTSGERLKEGGSINKSLVTLGNVISTLADLSNRTGSSCRRSIFIPYRDSLLTWLLKDSLGGNSKTIMIATISPAECHYAETLSTLRYAKRAKKIVNKPVINEDPNVKLIRELRAENARLRAMLGDASIQSALTPLKSFVETKEQLTRNEEKVQELIEEWTDKWQETTRILQENKTLALRREGSGIVLDSDLPYLFCIDDNVLRTGMVLYHLKEGDTFVGRDDALRMPDIVLFGQGIEAQHCIIRYLAGEVALIPVDGATCYINNVRIQESTRLSQGALIRLGMNHLFRFNDPSEAARLREEWKSNKKCALLSVGKDTQWTWSCISMTDSAVGSDFGDLDEYERLEERRKQVQQLEVEHCMAEARRVAQMAEQEASIEQLKLTEEQLKKLANTTQDELQTLTASMEQHRETTRNETEHLRLERENLKQLAEQLEVDKAQARVEHQRLRRSSELEKARLEMAHERQLAEWAELEKEQKHQLMLRQIDSQNSMRRLERVQKVRDIEKNIWAENLAEMRQLVDEELQAIRHIAANISPRHSLNSPSVRVSQLCRTSEDMAVVSDEFDDNDSNFDLESLKLRLSFNEDGEISGLPDAYLTQSSGTAAGLRVDSPVSSLLDSDDSVSALCSHLGYQVTQLHGRVCESLQRKYSSVLRCDDHTAELSSDVVTQFGEIRPLFEHLEKLMETEDVDCNIVNKLTEFDRLLSTVDKFIQIHEALMQIDARLHDRRYLEAITNLETIHEILLSLDIELELESAVVKVLQTELCVARERVLFELGESWNQLIHWTLPTDMRRSQSLVASLNVTKNGSEREVLNQVMDAMARVNMLPMRTKTFAERVMNYLIDPVVCDRSAVVQINDEAEHATIRVIVKSSPEGPVPVPPSEAFQKLEQILTFLHTLLTGVLNCRTAGVKPLLTMEDFSSLISEWLCDRVYENCILPAMPLAGNAETWTSFGAVMADTERFQLLLQQLGFLHATGNADDECSAELLMDRLNNANAKFANVKSQELLRHAHRLIMLELMNSVRVSAEEPMGTTDSARHHPTELDKFVASCREQVDISGLRLPSCQISIAVCDLTSLAYDTLREALVSSHEAAYHLCNAVHSMLELYSDVVPSLHKDKITSLPLAAALHHNNCMFIAHHVVIIDKAFRHKLIPDTGATSMGDGCEPRLAELVPKMRRLGSDSFSAYLDARKLQLRRLITEANGFTCIADDNGANAMKVMHTLFHHLKHLGAIWSDVLPLKVYLRSLGILLDSSFTDIIELILGIEELSADDCDCFHNVLEYMSNGAVDLFRPSASDSSPEVIVQEVAPDWMKVRELGFVIGASLQEVSDRWADGKGHLALYFSGEEVAKLVAASFEKTSRRDALISQLRRHHFKTCTV